MTATFYSRSGSSPPGEAAIRAYESAPGNETRAARHVRRLAALASGVSPLGEPLTWTASIRPGDHGAACIARDVGVKASEETGPGAEQCWAWVPQEITQSSSSKCPIRQVCPCCGFDEHHGSYCSFCGLPTGPIDEYRPAGRNSREKAKEGLRGMSPEASARAKVRLAAFNARRKAAAAARRRSIVPAGVAEG